PGLQAANGFELGFQGNLEGIKHDRFDLFFVHRVLLSGCCKGGYDRQVGMSTKIITYLRKMSKLQSPLIKGERSRRLQGLSREPARPDANKTTPKGLCPLY